MNYLNLKLVLFVLIACHTSLTVEAYALRLATDVAVSASAGILRGYHGFGEALQGGAACPCTATDNVVPEDLNMPPTSDRIATPLLIIFGLVNLPLSMLLSPTAAMLPNFYLEYIAVTLAGLATATLVARLFDGITDPLIGYLSDRAGNRRGVV